MYELLDLVSEFSYIPKHFNRAVNIWYNLYGMDIIKHDIFHTKN